MDEQLEAEAFCRQLDVVLSGGAPGPADDETARDLHFAARLSRFDLSGESRVRRGARRRAHGHGPL